jgi:predicted component of type VI protein secretion system
MNEAYSALLAAAALLVTVGCDRSPIPGASDTTSPETKVVRLHVYGFKKSNSGAT